MNETNWKSHLQTGVEAFHRRQWASALESLQLAHGLAPRERDISYWLANTLRMCGRPADAERIFRDLLSRSADDTEAAFALAYLLRDAGKPAQLARVLLSLAGHRQDDLETLLKIGGFLRDNNCFTEAISVLQMAVQANPGDAGLAFKLARLHQAVGRFEEALAELRRALQLDPHLGGAWLNLAQLQRFSGSASPDWQLISAAAAGESLGEEADMCLAFALGKAYDDMGEWRSAWEAYQRGNRMRSDSQPWDRQAWCEFLENTLSAGPPPPGERTPTDRHPVFIVGMLRSGTTLLEELLDRHALITGRGELNLMGHLASAKPGFGRLPPVQKRALADELWSHMQLEGANRIRYVDKNPLNFRYLGLLLDILPEARVIHVDRDGRDSCLSCYFQLFQHPDAGFANDLDDLQLFYRGYRQLMAHWSRRFPDTVHTVSYRDLVNSPRASLEKILDFLGLEWDDNLEQGPGSSRPVRTASSWQARQPLHQSSLSRWRNYHALAPEFFDAIARVDEEHSRA